MTDRPENKPPLEDLQRFRERVEAIESHRHLSGKFIKYVLITVALALFFLIGSIFIKASCLWNLLGILALLITIPPIYLWFQYRRAEEFEERLRSEKIRDYNTGPRCIHLHGYVPDRPGKIGQCSFYDFTLDRYPYCIYCRAYTPIKK